MNGSQCGPEREINCCFCTFLSFPRTQNWSLRRETLDRSLKVGVSLRADCGGTPPEARTQNSVSYKDLWVVYLKITFYWKRFYCGKIYITFSILANLIFFVD